MLTLIITLGILAFFALVYCAAVGVLTILAACNDIRMRRIVEECDQEDDRDDAALGALLRGEGKR